MLLKADSLQRLVVVLCRQLILLLVYVLLCLQHEQHCRG